MKRITVTIDGPAGAGKTTVARQLAQELGYTYLDTGAMYRALTWKALSQKVDLNNEAALVELARTTKIALTSHPDYTQVLVDGQDVSQAIRQPEVSRGTSAIADAAGVREILVSLQRHLAAAGGVILEGRDTGTVVCPQAEKKFYLDASVAARAGRRVKELLAKGLDVNYEQTLNDIATRDLRDMSRPVGALKKAADAISVDTTNLSISDVVRTIKRQIDHA